MPFRSFRVIWQGIISMMFCALFSIQIVAADLDMRRLASEATDVQHDDRRRQMLNQDLLEYGHERQKADLLLARWIPRRLPNPRRRVPDLGRPNIVSDIVQTVVGDQGLIDHLWRRKFRREMGQLRERDLDLYQQIVDSHPGTYERARLISQALPTDPICDECSSEQHLALLRFELEKIQRYLGMTASDLAGEAAQRGINREAILRLGQELRKLDDANENIVRKVRDVQERVQTQLGQTDDRVGEVESEVTRLGRIVVVQDRILTEDGRVLDIHGGLLHEHDRRLNSLQGEVIDLDEAYGQLADDVQFNEALVYGVLPTSDKIKALGNPRFLEDRFSDEEERRNAIQRLRVQETTQEILGVARDVQNSANAVANILQTTDVMSSEEASDVMNAAQVVGSAALLAASIPSLNVPGILVGISGMLGTLSGGSETSPDPQEMARLGVISDRQLEMLDRQNRILQGQHEIANGQKRLLNEVVDFERRMLSQFEEVSDSFVDVHWEISGIRELLREEAFLGVNLAHCENFVHRRGDYGLVSNRSREYVPEEVHFATGTWRNWGEIAAHYESNRAEWNGCFFQAMRQLFSALTIHREHLMSTYSSDTGQGFITSYINPGFKPLVRLLARHYPLVAGDANSRERMRTFCSLLNSPFTYEGIDFRGYAEFADTIGQYCRLEDGPDSIVTDFSRDPSQWLIHPNALIYLSYLLMEVLPYYQMTDEGGNLLAPDVVAYEEPRNDRIVEIELVRTAYRLVNLAIAQQTLLTGDIFLPLVHRYLFSSNIDPQDRMDVINILMHNKLVARNFLIMQLRRDLQMNMKHNNDIDDPRTVFSENWKLYRSIYCSRDPNEGDCGENGHEKLVYERLFATYWDFSSNTNNVILRLEMGTDIEEVIIPLPTPRELASGIYHVSREYEELMRLRRKVVDYAHRNDLQIFPDQELVTQDGYFVWQ